MDERHERFCSLFSPFSQRSERLHVDRLRAGTSRHRQEHRVAAFGAFGGGGGEDGGGDALEDGDAIVAPHLVPAVVADAVALEFVHVEAEQVVFVVAAVVRGEPGAEEVGDVD